MLQLALYPDVQRKVREEIEHVFPGETFNFTLENLDRLQYLNCVIKETQRYCTRIFYIAHFNININFAYITSKGGCFLNTKHLLI